MRPTLNKLRSEEPLQVDSGTAIANAQPVHHDAVSTRREVVFEQPSDLRAHAEVVGAAIRASFEEIVLGVCGPTPRPSHLISKLGLDKTLAGRLIQTTRSPEPLTTLSRSPSPVGLGIFLRSLQHVRVQPESVARAEAAIGQFQLLLDRFPRGRAGLEAAISGWMPETREQGERSARQAAFKSMSFILGYQSDVTLGFSLLMPGEDPRLIDVAYVSGQFGLRRLRIGEPLSVFGTRYYPLGETGDPNANPRTLDGRSIEESSCILSEFCDPVTPRLDVVKTKDQRLFVLPADEPALNEPISVVIGHCTRRSWQRYSTPQRREEWQTMMARCPTRVFINDTFIHKDVYPGVEPVITTHIVGVSPLPARERGPSFPLDEVHLHKESGWIRNDLKNIGTGEIPHHPELVASAFDRLGQNPADYRVHRLRMYHPVSGIVATRWFELPPEPGSVSDHAASA